MEPFLIVALSSTAVAGADANPLRDQTDGKYASRVLLGRRRALWLWVRACINACPQRFCSCLHFQPCLDIPALFTSHDGAMVMSVRGATLTFRGAESCPPCKQCPEPEACPIQEPCPEPEPIQPPPPPKGACAPELSLAVFSGKAASPPATITAQTIVAAGRGLFPFDSGNDLAYRCVFGWGNEGLNASSPASVKKVDGQSMWVHQDIPLTQSCSLHYSCFPPLPCLLHLLPVGCAVSAFLRIHSRLIIHYPPPIMYWRSADVT